MKTLTRTETIKAYEYGELGDEAKERILYEEENRIAEFFNNSGEYESTEEKINSRLNALGIEASVDFDNRHGWNFLDITISGEFEPTDGAGLRGGFYWKHDRDKLMAAWMDFIGHEHRPLLERAFDLIGREQMAGMKIVAESDAYGMEHYSTRKVAQTWYVWANREMGPEAKAEAVANIKKLEEIIYKALVTYLTEMAEDLREFYDEEIRRVEYDLENDEYERLYDAHGTAVWNNDGGMANGYEEAAA